MWSICIVRLVNSKYRHVRTYPLGLAHAFRSDQSLRARTNNAPDVSAVRHRLLVVCLIRRKARTAGTYRPLDEMYTDCPRTWPNKATRKYRQTRPLQARYTLLQSSYLPILYPPISLRNDSLYRFIFYVYVRIYFYVFIICYFIFSLILYNIENERVRVWRM